MIDLFGFCHKSAARLYRQAIPVKFHVDTDDIRPVTISELICYQFVVLRAICLLSI